MKLFVLDGGWRGALAVVAETKEAAREAVKRMPAADRADIAGEDPHDVWEEHEIVDGLVVSFCGDH